MKASEKMAARAGLYAKLVETDQRILQGASGQVRNRITASPTALLSTRHRICAELIDVGYYPWGAPLAAVG
jgi:hypothetical protein